MERDASTCLRRAARFTATQTQTHTHGFSACTPNMAPRDSCHLLGVLFFVERLFDVKAASHLKATVLCTMCREKSYSPVLMSIYHQRSSINYMRACIQTLGVFQKSSFALTFGLMLQICSLQVTYHYLICSEGTAPSDP